MQPVLPFLLVVAASLCAACSKPASNSSEAAPPPPPRGNLSESLGIVSSDDVYAAPPRASAPPPASAAAPITRTLTGKDGRTLDAVLLSRTETGVKIRRTADSAEFVIPFDKLSAADRAFIEQSGLPITPGR